MVRLVDALVHGGGDDDDDDDGGGYYYFAFGWECGGRPMSLRLGGKELQNMCYIDKRMSSRSEAKCPGPVNKERPKIWAEKTVDSLNYIGE
uniref:Uncharacterized protein n=1 Tax=Oryza glumipatula TaxID=40148 RepID=A0A0D9Z3S0_9ORYZ